MTQFQFSTYIPFRIDDVLIAEEVACEVFVELDCNDEPRVEEIWIENLDGKHPLKLFPADKLFKELEREAWEAVRGDVQDAMQEAA